MSKFIGVDTSNIDNVSGFFVTQGGGGSIEDFALTEADTGVLMWGGGAGSQDVLKIKVDGDVIIPSAVPSKGQLTTATISKGNFKFGGFGSAYLTDSGDLYTCWPSASFTSAIGRAVTASAPADEYHLAAQNVANFFVGYGGIMYVSTSGTFHHSGNGAYFGNSGTTANYSFAQIGSDTDWVSIHGDPYPYYGSTVYIAVKGSNGGKLYVIGSNGEGKTGQNTTSGLTSSWTLMSDGTASGTFDVEGWTDIKVMSDSPAAIDSTGRLWRWGEGFYGALGTGSSSDILYPQQVGSDTDWEYLGPTRNVMMAIKGGEIWYCSSGNYGNPFGTGLTFDKTWRQFTSTSGLWEEIDANDGMAQNYVWTGKYNGDYVVYSSNPANYGSHNLPSNSSLSDNSNGIGGTRFVNISDLANPIDSGSTINWIHSYCGNNRSDATFLLIRASS